jgi:hypothetical protein
VVVAVAEDARLACLTIDDVIGHDGRVFIRLGDPPAPVPEPFAAMLTELAANHANTPTAANPACLWLLPGGRAGRPLTSGALVQQVRAPGAATTQTRTRRSASWSGSPCPGRRACPRLQPRNRHLPRHRRRRNLAPLPGHPRREHRDDPAARWFRFPIRRTWNDGPQGRCGRGS